MKLQLFLAVVCAIAFFQLQASTEDQCEIEFQKCVKERSSFISQFVSYKDSCESLKKECLKKQCIKRAVGAREICWKRSGILFGITSCDELYKAAIKTCHRESSENN